MSTNVATPSSEESTPATATPTVTVLPLPNGNSGNFTMDPPTGNNNNSSPALIPGVNGLGSVSAGTRSVHPAFGFGPILRWMRGRNTAFALLPCSSNHKSLGLQDRHKFDTQSLPLDRAYGDTIWETLDKTSRAVWHNGLGFGRTQMTWTSLFSDTFFGLFSMVLRLALPALPYLVVRQIL